MKIKVPRFRCEFVPGHHWVGYRRCQDSEESLGLSRAESMCLLKWHPQLPFADSTQYGIISISPFDFEITLQAMTIEKLQFALPAVFTIGPDDEPDSLKNYAKILTGKSGAQQSAPTATGRSHVQDIVKGIIEGETRSIVSGMTMEEIFKERQVFKTKVIENVQSELNQFGLRM